MEKFRHLVETGAITEAELREAAMDADFRKVNIEKILRHEHHVTRRHLLEALSAHHRCPWVEYDERIPVPFDFLTAMEPENTCMEGWFPVAKDGQTAIIATSHPEDPDLPAKVKACIHVENYEFRVALAEDVDAFIEDFLNSNPRHLVGNERTSLALWRNTMARWRTKLACYRTEFANVRTNLALLGGGMGLIAISRTLLRLHPSAPPHQLAFYWSLIGIGLCLVGYGAYHYIWIKRHVMRPPKHQTLVEVTWATLHFLEDHQFVHDGQYSVPIRETMLARLAEHPLRHQIVMDKSMDNKKRSYLAHERNLLSAQRTIAACYRTIYARARTGLAFIQTGISFLAVGIGLLDYFGIHLLTALDVVLIAASIWLIVDGAGWYLPARKEQAEIPDYLIYPAREVSMDVPPGILP